MPKNVGAVLKVLEMPSCSQTISTIPLDVIYALLINEWHLLARAVFVLDTDNTIHYVEYVDNINSEPNFEAAIAAAKELKLEAIVADS